MLKRKGWDGKSKEPVKRESGSYIGKTEDGTHTFVFSNAQIDRYGDTIDVKGWQLANYEANPIVLFGHDASDVKNVVGTTVKTWVEDGNLMGEIKFADEGVNPNADIVRKLVESKILRTVSVGFRPLEAKASSDPQRRGGFDFKKQELLEVSIVPVPALPSALAKAAPGADLGFVRREMTREAITRIKGLGTVSWLAGLLMELGWIEECCEEEAACEGDNSPIPAQLESALKLLGQILVDMTKEEVAELLGEEVGEVTENGMMDGDEGPEGVMELPTEAKAKMQLIQYARKLDFGAAVGIGAAMKAHIEGKKVTFSVKGGVSGSLERAGRVLSKENETALAGVKSALTDACAVVDKVLSQVAIPEGGEEPTVTETKNSEAEIERRRKIVAQRLQNSVN